MPRFSTLVTFVAIPVFWLLPDMQIAGELPDVQVAGAILIAAIELWVCGLLIALGGLGILNMFCRWKLKREGVTDESMAELQRWMIGYTCKTPKEVETLLWWMRLWGAGHRRKYVARAMARAGNVIDFRKWRERRDKFLEAAE